MKLFLLILILNFEKCRQYSFGKPFQLLLAKGFNEWIDRGLKHKYGDSFTTNDICSDNCVTAPPQGFGKIMALFREPNLEHMKNLYDKDLLTNSCNYVNPLILCVNACPISKRTSFINNVLVPLKYACAESNFVSHASCFKEVWDMEHKRCSSSDQCSGASAAFNVKHNTYKKTKKDNGDMLRNFCALMDCVMDCGKSKRIEKCTAEGQTVFTNFWRKVTESMVESKFLFDRYSIIDNLPSCTSIGHD